MLTAMTTTCPSPSTASYDSIKLVIDAHAQYYWVGRESGLAERVGVVEVTCSN